MTVTDTIGVGREMTRTIGIALACSALVAASDQAPDAQRKV